jgi:hypothetical protein
MGLVQTAAIGAPFAQLGAIQGIAQQTSQLLAQAQSHTAAAHGLAPPPPPPPEATQEGSLAAQQAALAEASQLLTGMTAASPMSAGAAQQAQALISQAQAVTGDDPQEIVATQQQLLAAAVGSLQAVGAQGPVTDGGHAAALSQQVAAVIGEANAFTAMAHGVQPPMPDPYELISMQNAILQGSLSGIASASAATNPQAMQAAQQALGLVGANQARMSRIQQELTEAQAEARVAEQAPPASRLDLESDAIAAARAQAGVGEGRVVDERAAAHAAAEDFVPSVSSDLQEALVIQHQAVNSALNAMLAQGGAGATAAQQVQARLAEVQETINAAATGRGIAPDAALAAQQQAITQAIQTVVASGSPAASGVAQQMQALMAQSQQASTQVRAQIAEHYGDTPANPAADLQTAMAAQHQVVDQTLHAMMGAGPQAMVAAQQAQQVLTAAEARIAGAPAAGPGAISVDQAVAIQQAAYAQALQAVAATGGVGASATASIQQLMAQTQQAAARLAETAVDPTTTRADEAMAQRAAGTASQADDAMAQRAAAGQQTASQADDGFDDDIMAAHLQGAPGDQRSEVMQRLDPDGDGHINRGIIGPRGVATGLDDAPDDELGELDWQASAGDALTGDAPAEPVGAPMAAAPMAEEPDAAPAPMPVDEAPQPVEAAPPPPPPPLPEPDDVPDDLPAEPVDVAEPEPAPEPDPEPAPSYEAPEPEPEPVTHDDGDYFN